MKFFFLFKFSANCLQNYHQNIIPSYDSLCKNSLDNNKEMITMFCMFGLVWFFEI